MRLLELHLQAYGPFTDRRLDLSAGQQGLQVIYGPNEAGKSTALRALRGLLYGIPARTRDDFVHKMPALRIGGRFRRADGSELTVYRKKGNKDTLLDVDGNAVDGDSLTQLLGGVDERLFEQLFGIDHESMVSGGQALLDERGREAEALFGTGLGSNAIHAVLQQLDQEAQELFAPRASKPLINAQLHRLKTIEGQQREASLSARQWDEARKAAGHARDELNAIDTELSELNKQRSRLERIRRTLPGLAKRAAIHQQRKELGDVSDLPDDFGERREQAVSNRRAAAQACSRTEPRIGDLEQTIASLAVSEELLAEADSVDELRDRLGGYRKAAADRPRLDARLVEVERQAGQRLAEVRPELSIVDVDSLRPLIGRRRRSTELGGQQGALESAARKLAKELSEAERKLAAKRDALSSLAPSLPIEGLRQTVVEARRDGNLDRALDDADARVARADAECARDLAALGLWTGDLASLLASPLPAVETVRRFIEHWQTHDGERSKLAEARSEAEAERKRTDETLREQQLAGEVPTEVALNEARKHRDDGWQLLRRQWVDGENVSDEAIDYASETPLPDAFESAMVGADDISDRLRREAQRVHEQATAQARLASCDQRLTETEVAFARLAKAREDLDAEWQAVWSPWAITPHPPTEMLPWLEDVSRLRDKAGQRDEYREQRDGLVRRRDGHFVNLRAALGETQAGEGESQQLAVRLQHAENRLGELQAVERQRGDLEADVSELDATVHRLRSEAKTAGEQLTAWRADWSALMRDLGLEDTASPVEVSDYLEVIEAVVRLVDEAVGLRARIEGIDTDAKLFEEAVKSLVARFAEDLLEQPLDQAVSRLSARLGEQRDAKSRRDALRKELRKAQEELRQASADLQASERMLEELCRQAGCESPDQLESIEQRHRDHRRLKRQLGEVETELLEGGDGRDIETLHSEAETVDRDAVAAELDALVGRIEQELRPRQETLLERKLTAERDFEAMGGGGEASALAEEVQQTLSGLRSLAERYMRVKLAGRVLRDEIERFRRQHRDPILTRAGGYFKKLTVGSFASIESDYDESDQPVLVGVRPTEERLRVEAMSTGTRDQLYLALRLATLDHYLDSAEAMPFIVDDILIQFDEPRAEATLDALADFSARSQVILFTHHNRVVEQAESLESASDRIFVHELS